MAHPPRRDSLNGRGKAILRSLGRDAVFSELSYAYPLKLLSPKLHSSRKTAGVAIVYILSYGGGLVSGDRVELSVDVGQSTLLIALTQGSTKIYRTRSALDRVRASNPSSSSLDTGVQPQLPQSSQKINVKVAGSGCLLLLPDPVTCFGDASYSQVQAFHLESLAGSLAILDWFTSGRMSRGEEWQFSRYRSVNEILIGGKRVVRDVMLLEDPTLSTSGMATSPSPLAVRPLKDRLAPYSCYGTLFLFGPMMADVLSNLRRQYDSTTQFQNSDPPTFIWSFSAIESGGIVRVAAIETEMVRQWMRRALEGLIEYVGEEAYSKIFL